MSVEVLLNTYGHHHPDHLRAAADAFGSRSAKKNVWSNMWSAEMPAD
jgi:hypothetical protein